MREQLSLENNGKSRILNVKTAAAYIGICPSILRMYVKKGLLQPLQFQGRTGKRIQKLLFDINEIDALIDKIKRGEVWQEKEEPPKEKAVSSNQEEGTSGTSNTPLETGKQDGSQQEQQIEKRQIDSVGDYFRKWKEAYH